MAPIKSPRDIETAVRDGLNGTRYAVVSLVPLTGGTANFIYRAELQHPLADGVAEVLVKHGEGYVAQHPGLALTTLRCEIEVESLRLLSSFPHVSSPAFDMGTPETYYFDASTSTQVQEYLPNAISLKDYALKHYQSPGSSREARPQCVQLGVCLGRWLRAFHDWSDGDGPGGRDVRALFARNTDMRALKKTVNYDRLLRRAEELPALLGGDADVLRRIVDMASAELEDDAGGLKVMHGDFWTGK
ncbi:hypothetical protein E4U41_006249 [Claviceps citrina]|nr:hypothetical protein E4U41_006249 [Claviceps citrina]